ncbi:MAG: hypothetical protein KF779_10380 [Hyphomonadaceae bacterium]|nr:hypothetical protein [Hyphomonadaceae bacterium]
MTDVGQEERLLSLSIANILAEAAGDENAVVALDGDPDMVEELWEVQASLQFKLDRAFREMRMLTDRLGLKSLGAEIARYCQETPSFSEVEPFPFSEPGKYAPSLRQARIYFDSLSAMTLGTRVSGLEVFKTILRNSGAIIAARGLEPKNEKEVEKAIYQVVSWCFHDAVAQMTIPQLVKNYKPEFGVRSLMAAAEYKFATTEQEVKIALDGFYSDMRGYSGSHEWRNFFAVLYTTEPLLHQQKLEAEFAGVGADKNWAAILVTGPGAKAKKAKAA